jgi:hypothetical protein
MVDPTESELAGVRPNTKLPVVVMPGTLSVATEMDAAATEVTVLPAGGSVAAADSAVMIPLGVAADMACTVKVAPLATLELILQLLVKTRLNAEVGVSAVAIVHVIFVYRTAGDAGGQTGAGKGSSAVVHWPVVVVVPPVVV